MFNIDLATTITLQNWNVELQDFVVVEGSDDIPEGGKLQAVVTTNSMLEITSNEEGTLCAHMVSKYKE